MCPLKCINDSVVWLIIIDVLTVDSIEKWYCLTNLLEKSDIESPVFAYRWFNFRIEVDDDITPVLTLNHWLKQLYSKKTKEIDHVSVGTNHLRNMQNIKQHWLCEGCLTA